MNSFPEEGCLSQAHSADIIHRDLEPASVMVDRHGAVKVLDFGLPKMSLGGIAPDDPTQTLKPVTEEGTSLGAVADMSPEQAQSHAIDVRSDIFSFGAVLSEMVTGRRAFAGESRMSTLCAIIDKEPEPIGTGISHDLERLLSRCLRKEPAWRFQHMDDVQVAFALEEALKLFPRYRYALANLAKVRMAQGRDEEAVKLLEQRYRAAPHPENPFDLGVAQVGAKQTGQGEGVCRDRAERDREAARRAHARCVRLGAAQGGPGGRGAA